MSHESGVQTGLLLQFATGHFHRVCFRLLLPGALRKLPIATLHRVAILLNEVHATVILDRNDNHEIGLLDDAINSNGAISTTDRVLAYPHPSVLVDQPSAGGLDVYTFVGCHLTLSWELFATSAFGSILNFLMSS